MVIMRKQSKTESLCKEIITFNGTDQETAGSLVIATVADKVTGYSLDIILLQRISVFEIDVQLRDALYLIAVIVQHKMDCMVSSTVPLIAIQGITVICISCVLLFPTTD